MQVTKMSIITRGSGRRNQCLARDAVSYCLPSRHSGPRMLHCEDMKGHGTFIVETDHLGVSGLAQPIVHGMISTHVHFHHFCSTLMLQHGWPYQGQCQLISTGLEELALGRA